ncbi:MAG: ATP-binding cassette domain-containing protein [Thermoanaerobaculia bacterium]
MVSSRDPVSTTTLTAEKLDKSFSGPPLFSGLDLRAETGLVAVSGKNGSGKTTFLKILAGLMRPTAGRVLVERDGRPLPEPERRLALGWAGPDLALYGELTAEENLLFFRRAAGRQTSLEDIRRRLSQAGLSEASGRRVEQYSTGMTQRLRIAFATLFDPPLLLLDEPTAGLDAEGRAMALGVIDHARRHGAVVVASNDERDFVAPEQRVELGGGGSREP